MTGHPQPNTPTSWPNLLLIGAVLLITAYFSTVVEDAFISFRVVDNAVHGYGLRWNVFERVQAFTNPLWTLLHIPFYALWPDIVVVTISLSVLCTGGALWLAHLTSQAGWRGYGGLFIAPLATSYCFVQHSTTGLENPMSHLLFAAFGWALLRAPERRKWLYLSLFAGLGMVNRLDSVFLYLPIGLCLLMAYYRTINYRQIMLGSMPMIAWLMFSIVYYGFFLPNTKYAKLPDNIEALDYITHGFYYLANLFALDVTSGILLFLSMLSVPYLKYSRRISTPIELVAVSIGLACYVAYTMSVGGDHITGRFWSVHIFIAAWLVLMMFAQRIQAAHGLAIAAFCIITRVAYPDVTTIKNWCPPCFGGDIFPSSASKLNVRDYMSQPEEQKNISRDGNHTLAIEGMVGMRGYYAGASGIIIDYFGLTDPLLARLPTHLRHIRRIGHMPRTIPVGYPHAIATGDLHYMDYNLAIYYRHLRVLTQEPLWSGGRLGKIILFQIGEYDSLLSE